MFNITYFAPDKLSDALDYLSEHKHARVLAGGTDLVVKWKKTGNPDMDLVDIRNIEKLKDIYASQSGLFVGCGATMVMVQSNDLVNEMFPILAEAASNIGSVQIRNMATIGGNSCNASPSADTVLPLIVYGAEAVIISKDVEKRCPLEKFFVGPGKTILKQGELLKGFFVPRPTKGTYAVFARGSRRVGMDLATVGVAIAICLAGNVIRSIRVALGAVAPIPLLINGLEEFIGAKISEDIIEEIASISAQQAIPITDVRGSKEYRKEMIYENVKKCFLEAQKK